MRFLALLTLCVLVIFPHASYSAAVDATGIYGLLPGVSIEAAKAKAEELGLVCEEEMTLTDEVNREVVQWFYAGTLEGMPGQLLFTALVDAEDIFSVELALRTDDQAEKETATRLFTEVETLYVKKWGCRKKWEMPFFIGGIRVENIF